MNAEETLAQIAAEVSGCVSCVLHKTRKKSVPGEGPANCEIMFIGEGPGQNENEQGRPFVGAAGSFLNQLLAQANLKREDVWIGNVVKCRPPDNRDPMPEELAACNVYLERQINAINPSIIVTLGRFSMGKFMPGAKISAVHGHHHPGRFRQTAATAGCGTQGIGKVRACRGESRRTEGRAAAVEFVLRK
jgi:uracil-DNA glycosylase family 4